MKNHLVNLSELIEFNSKKEKEIYSITDSMEAKTVIFLHDLFGENKTIKFVRDIDEDDLEDDMIIQLVTDDLFLLEMPSNYFNLPSDYDYEFVHNLKYDNNLSKLSYSNDGGLNYYPFNEMPSVDMQIEFIKYLTLLVKEFLEQ